MKSRTVVYSLWSVRRALAFGAVGAFLAGCGGNGGLPEVPAGALLQGTVINADLAPAFVGVPGIDVTLARDLDPTNLVPPVGDQIIDRDVTGAEGRFEFEDVPTGRPLFLFANDPAGTFRPRFFRVDPLAPRAFLVGRTPLVPVNSTIPPDPPNTLFPFVP